MKASVVVPTYRGAARLPRLIEALSRQDHDDWEAVIVIDGAVDDSAAIVQGYAGLPLRTVVFPDNRGRVAALNAGFERASGQVLIRCDDDLEPDPSYLSRHVRQHASASGPIGVVGLVRNQLAATAYARVYGNHADELHRAAAYRAGAQDRWRFWAGNCSISRSTWEQVGPYDVRYRAYGWEDIDYGYRLHQHGVPIVLDPSLEISHHAAATTTLSRARRAFLSGQARHLFDDIHGPGTSGPSDLRVTSAWTAVVSGLSRGLDYRRTEALSRRIDAAIEHLPTPVARKAVAAVVEAAAVAGYARGSGVTDDL
ncbi:glycosyltransferase family 2 protein [Calidifontibacter sp. DB0510]|uniref:Glycosyltransferase family 2 protein n=1 Tax=Metallococcus carri TaxID=1656884 RepID=A0A967B3G2_9MICO|nr:glycosyltransferase family 2 protein [Metallococcus carri]NHN56575.1 glycosyltransferase family 2 protein [Metallococcus carri]NOP38874.1 glycosyltransferase family 2 protein [Calidifontibacter sp. DB2511S]